VVRSLVAVQSQDYPGATWALGQRLDGWNQASIDAAFDDGAFIRTHLLRPTWHFVAPEDLRWLLALSGPRLRRGAAHRHRALEIDDELITRSIAVFERALGRAGALTRQELRRALAEEGIDAAGGRLAHLVMVAEYEAVLCSGPRRGAEHTYALVEERVPPSSPRARDEALAELASRYVAGHGPAQDVDLAWWSGLSLGDARRGLAAASPALRREVIGDRTFWTADTGPEAGEASTAGPSVSDGPSVQLLPNYDELLVAFRDRRDALDPSLPGWARTAGEIFSNVIARDGLVVGRWMRTIGAGPIRLVVDARVDLGHDERAGVVAAAERYAAFAGREVELAGLD